MVIRIYSIIFWIEDKIPTDNKVKKKVAWPQLLAIVGGPKSMKKHGEYSSNLLN